MNFHYVYHVQVQVNKVYQNNQLINIDNHHHQLDNNLLEILHPMIKQKNNRLQFRKKYYFVFHLKKTCTLDISVE